jgi:hypothetical protein
MLVSMRAMASRRSLQSEIRVDRRFTASQNL